MKLRLPCPSGLQRRVPVIELGTMPNLELTDAYRLLAAENFARGSTERDVSAWGGMVGRSENATSYKRFLNERTRALIGKTQNPGLAPP